MKSIINIDIFTKGTAITIPVIVVLFLINSCSGAPVRTSGVEDSSTYPSVRTTDAVIHISDSGFMRFRADAPEWLVFSSKDNPYWHFPQGVKFVKVDTLENVEATILADSAYYYEKPEIWKLMGNVDMTNEAGDNFKTQLLFWDAQKNQMYSDSFIHIKRTDQIMEGYGFVSNSKMTSYTIRRPSGIFPVVEKRDTTDVDSTKISPQE